MRRVGPVGEARSTSQEVPYAQKGCLLRNGGLLRDGIHTQDMAPVKASLEPKVPPPGTRLEELRGGANRGVLTGC